MSSTTSYVSNSPSAGQEAEFLERYLRHCEDRLAEQHILVGGRVVGRSTIAHQLPMWLRFKKMYAPEEIENAALEFRIMMFHEVIYARLQITPHVGSYLAFVRQTKLGALVSTLADSPESVRAPA